MTPKNRDPFLNLAVLVFQLDLLSALAFCRCRQRKQRPIWKMDIAAMAKNI